ncbi:helix-turn-helix domain-containing protein [Acinetobacter sp. SFD]|uniref:helix-turn-helix domain-containing protein n=1 Tax=Acinetobacter sp. SFD TaxID=1805635 RepID=UPI001D177742|nr:helix-turn-helix domain-containing protein [Acinetobacter sp. SFD]
MSSRLYRKEVWPFISDAARNVYAELENRINGHNKESDFVSYSQLQGGDLPGARKMGRTTVSTALQELVKLGVISVIASGKQGMKSYRLNEISLKDRFTNKTSTVTGLVSQQDQNGTASEPVTSPVTGHTIDTPIESLENNNKAPSEFVPQDRGALNFIDYHSDDQKLYTLKDLSGTYPIKQDFMAQAAVSFPKLSQDIVLEQLKELAQWSVGQPERISQKWMTTWLNWLRNYQPAKPKTEKPKTSKKSNANLNVNDAWKDQATYHAPVENFQVDIPEDFV